VRKILILLGAMAVVAIGSGRGSSTTASGSSSPAGSGNANAPDSLPGQTNNKVTSATMPATSNDGYNHGN
jgi:hypothetical protein